MFNQNPFVGPGSSSLTTHSAEILIMLAGAFVLGFLVARLLQKNDASKDRSRRIFVESAADTATPMHAKTPNTAPVLAFEASPASAATIVAGAGTLAHHAPAPAAPLQDTQASHVVVEAAEPAALVENTPQSPNSAPALTFEPSPTSAVAIGNSNAAPNDNANAPPAPTVAAPDDLKRIDGIGPKIEQILHAARITTFAALANTNEAWLREQLIAHNPRLRTQDTASWPTQAALARDGEWGKLHAMKKKTPRKKS